MFKLITKKLITTVEVSQIDREEESMFAQYDIKQVTDHCAIMHTKGWLYCWLSKHNSSVEFGQGLVKSLQKKPIYETIRKSDEIFFNLLFTRGDKKTAIVLGCNPRSSQGMSLFKQTLQWAKISGLSLEIAPNITTDDGETRQLLVELGLSQSHPGVIKAIPFWKKLFGRKK
jgi:hypothetical protein